MSARLDVLALGRDAAVSLGLPHRGVTLAAPASVAGLVSVSAALVRPLAFHGLIVAGMVQGLMRSAAVSGAILLVGGQGLFARQLNQATTLSVVVEVAGGLFFLYLLPRERIR